MLNLFKKENITEIVLLNFIFTANLYNRWMRVVEGKVERKEEGEVKRWENNFTMLLVVKENK